MKALKYEKIGFAFCMSVLTAILTLTTRENIAINSVSICVSFVGTLCLIKKCDLKSFFERISYQIKILSFVLAFFSEGLIKIRFENDWNIHMAEMMWVPMKMYATIFAAMLLISGVALFVYYCYLLEYLYENVVCKLLKTMDKEEKIVVYIFLSVMCLLSVYAHTHTSAFDFAKYYESNGSIGQYPFNAIMDCDSNATQWGIHSFTFMFRHPFFQIVALPEYVLSKAIGSFWGPSEQITMFFLSAFTILKLAICGLCIKRLTQNMWTMVMYYTSFPVLIYSLAIERHVWMLFWVVLMVYTSLQEEFEEVENYMPIMQAGGANLVGVVITPLVIRAKSFKEFLNKASKLAVSFLFIIIATGNFMGILNIKESLEENASFVNTAKWGELFKKFTIAIQTCFGNVKVKYGSYYSTYYDESGFSVFGALIIVICIVAVYYFRKNKYACICGWWFGLAVILFPIIGFSYEDFSMHMILFSWASISLVIMFISEMLNLFSGKLNKLFKIIVAIGLIWIWSTNIATLNELLTHALKFNCVS